MIYVNTGSTDVFYNFAAEYYFAREHIMDDDVFMIWRTTPTLMIGKFQNTLEEIDADKLHPEQDIHGILPKPRI